jgi:hypothetical protein
MASFCVPHNDQEDVEGTQQFWPSLSTRDGSPMTVRGGGDPVDSMAYHAVTENGSAASELRTDAHDCIMVRVLGPTEYKVVAR